MDNWFSYMPSEYYDNTLYSLFNIDKDKLQCDNTNSKKYFYDYISAIINNIDLSDKILYDCCCNIGSYCIFLSRYTKICYGMDINTDFIKIAQYVSSKEKIENCYFFNKSYFDINNKKWYYTNITQIDIVLCLSLGCKLFRDNIDRASCQFNMIQLIQHYKPQYIIFNKTKYDAYISFQNFIKVLKSLKYMVTDSAKLSENPLWIFTKQI